MNASIDVTPELLAGFLDEAPEYLGMLDAGLLAFENQASSGAITLDAPEDHERMNEMFRAAHSLKGLAAALGFDRIRDLTHLMETLFDEVRMGKRPLEADAFETLFRVFDRLRLLVQELAQPGGELVSIDDALEALGQLLRNGAQAKAPAASSSADPAPATDAGAAANAIADPAMVQLFFESTVEAVEQMSQGLLRLEATPSDLDVLNEVFRCAHNIKGASGMMGFSRLCRFTHQLETILDRLRSRRISLEERLMDALLAAVDVLRELVEKTRAGGEDHLLESGADLLLEPFLREAASVEAAPDACAPHAAAGGDGMAETRGGAARGMDWRITVSFPANLADAPIQAYLIKNKLEESGAVRSTEPDVETLDTAAALERMTYVLHADVDPEALRAVLCRYEVAQVLIEPTSGAPATNPPSSIEPAVDAAWTGASRAVDAPGKIVSDDSTHPSQAEISQQAPDDAAVQLALLHQQSRALADSAPEVAAPLPAISPRSPAARPADRGDGAAARGADAPGASKVGETVRVDLERLDQLMNLGGELVISKARFVQIHNRLAPLLSGKHDGHLAEELRERIERLRHCATRLGETGADSRILADMRDALLHLDHEGQCVGSVMEQVRRSRAAMHDFSEALHSLGRISEGLQKRIMETRMVSIGPLFGRFRRVVRDISRATGKEVSLELHGETTELDKRMIDELGDPLTHMVRNSVDHGIEAPQDRLKAGKPGAGIVTLSAYHRGRFICIEVRDDGRGINVEAIRRKVIERELATAPQADALSDRELIQYIFHPGFSTAAQVTDLSGRGMGMDIVKTKIEALSGTVEVDSTPGRGSCITIKLPLTLAIVTALLARVGEGTYALPLEGVAEIITVRRADIQSVRLRRVVRVRDRVIPVVLFEEVFNTARPALHTRTRNHDELTLVIVEFKEDRIGLAVDSLIGQEEVVIKSLATNHRNIAGVSGACILGDGAVALILDVSGMIQAFTAQSLAPARGRGERSVASGAPDRTGGSLASDALECSGVRP